ncbi:MAG: hypothetical protein P1V20_22630 [Verrucomicrobiales bacterium]|nr:hypothetical protein [Verrucomicrobiales bacterium]
MRIDVILIPSFEAVQIVNTDDPAKNGSVYVRKSTEAGIADYVITVHDAEHPQWDNSAEYDLQASQSQKAVNLPQQFEGRNR